jgi:catechol 2,3-dioxygenase-like lactoylglutathione lyase family enzyme
MLGSTVPIAFVPTTDPAQARSFFEDVLGLRFVSDDGFALVFESGGVMVRVVNVKGIGDFRPAPFTIVGWQVPDAEAAVRELAARGVVFQRVPGLSQDALGIWNAPGGARVAWFKDPTGNTLSISQH